MLCCLSNALGNLGTLTSAAALPVLYSAASLLVRRSKTTSMHTAASKLQKGWGGPQRVTLSHSPASFGLGVLPADRCRLFASTASRQAHLGLLRQQHVELLGLRRRLATSIQAGDSNSMAPADYSYPASSLVPPKSPVHPCGQLSSQNPLLLSPKRKQQLLQQSQLLNPFSQQGVLGAPHMHAFNQQPQGKQEVSSTASPSFNNTDLSKALRSVCKVYATLSSPNYATPWQMHQQSKSTASGFVIAPLSSRRILTNAHAVANQIQVQLRKHGNAKKFTARVLAVGHECDVAMLTVDDDEFWTGVEALEIGGLPDMQESVSVVGYPTGGDNVCVTKGVVSRIDRQQYSHGRTSLLALQIDAAINSGNSGGPVIKGDKVIGIAFQCLTAGENIGYVIPVPVINHFLNDLEWHSGRYTGFCDLGVCWQTLESNDLKTALSMPHNLTGVFVTAVEPCYHSAEVLKPGDVITHFNGHSIADDGTFLFNPEHHSAAVPAPGSGRTEASTPQLPEHSSNPPPQVAAVEAQLPVLALASENGSAQAGASDRTSPEPSLMTLSSPTAQQQEATETSATQTQPAQYLAAPPPVLFTAGPHSLMVLPHQQAVRIDFRHLVSMSFEGDYCHLGVWRDGTQLEGGVRTRLTPPQQLVPVHSHDQKPHYHIFGGLVFTRLTNFYLRSTYGVDWTHKAPIKLCDRSFAGVLEAPGQECVILAKVLSWECNTGYQDLGNVEVLKVAGVPVHNLAHLAYVLQHHKGPYVRLDLQWNKVVVLDVKRCKEAAASILSQNCIPGQGYFPDTLLSEPLELPPAIQAATDKALGLTPSVTSSVTSPAVGPRTPPMTSEGGASPTPMVPVPASCATSAMGSSNEAAANGSSGGGEAQTQAAAFVHNMGGALHSMATHESARDCGMSSRL